MFTMILETTLCIPYIVFETAFQTFTSKSYPILYLLAFHCIYHSLMPLKSSQIKNNNSLD